MNRRAANRELSTWTMRENVRGPAARSLKRILCKHVYAPDGQEKCDAAGDGAGGSTVREWALA
jgi:hypothetical protein